MSTWTDEYKKKLITPDQAANLVQDGDFVYTTDAILQCFEFERALAKRAGDLKDVLVFSGPQVGPVAYLDADKTGESFTYLAHSFGAPDRKAWAKSHAEGIDNINMIPTMNHEFKGFILGKAPWVRPRIFVVRATAMNEQGFFNWGLNVCGWRYDAMYADIVIVEVVKGMPWIPGGSGESIHISEVDYIIESDIPIPTIKEEIPTTPEEEIIANEIAPLIKDRSVIELGIGGVPNQIGKILEDSDLKDLGCHTETFNDALARLMQKRIITNKYKEYDRFRTCYSIIIGVTQETLDWCNNNPELAAYDGEYSNCVPNIARLDNFVSVCAFVNIDLQSQVNGESDGFRLISGGGGQLDFQYGAWESNGGIPILCNTSSFIDKNGERQSRIVLAHKPGTIVTTPRQVVAYVATEYGIENMKACSQWKRAEKLVGLAHPDFRDELLEQAAEAGIFSKTHRARF